MKKALLIGINYYDNPSITNLNCCHNDVDNVNYLLSNNYENGEKSPKNFTCDILKSSTGGEKLTKSVLKPRIEAFFKDSGTDVAIFYFSGHGYEDSLGGYLVTQDASGYNEGVPFKDILQYANNSMIKDIIIILDCCNSGNMGASTLGNIEMTHIRKGISILTSSLSDQNSYEQDGNGVFTKHICEALEGANSDLQGNIKLSHIYEYVDNMLDPLLQRPTFKSNASRLIKIRESKPRIPYSTLTTIVEYFKGPDFYLSLSPSYEPTAKPRNLEHESVFKNLQKMASVGLITPVGEEHMYFAAMNQKGCKLTNYGKQYWYLLSMGRI